MTDLTAIDAIVAVDSRPAQLLYLVGRVRQLGKGPRLQTLPCAGLDHA